MNSQNPNLRILILSLEYSPEISGGVGTHAQELSTGLADAGDSVSVLSCTVGKPECRVEGNKRVYLLPPETDTKGRSIAQGILNFNRTLAEYARRIIIPEAGVPDIIQCYNWITYPVAEILSHAFEAPVVSTIQYVSEPVERWWGQTPDPEIVAQEKNLFRNAERFIAVSRSIRAMMRDTYAVPESRVDVIYNAMDPRFFTQLSVSQEYLERLRQSVAPGNEKIVLYAGRFHPMKGVSALLESAVRVLKSEPNVRYLMAGEPDSQAFAREFQDLLRQNPILQSKITILGKLSRKKLAVLYSVANAALVPSVYDPCPYAAIEAMAAGVPLIVSDGGGLDELVQHGVNGLKVPVRTNENRAGLCSVDPGELADATLLLLRDEPLATALGAAAREKAREAYSREVMVRATRDVYHVMLLQREHRQLAS